MKKGYLRTIIAFAFSRPSMRDRTMYLIRGIAFAPWLARSVTGQSSRDQAGAATSAAGDDIYPLF